MRIINYVFFLTVIFLLSSSLMAKKTDPVIGERKINFINLCPFPVWLTLAGGSSFNIHQDNTTTCNTNADCFSGNECVQTGAIKQCFWHNPIPEDGRFKLDPRGGRNSVTIPIYQSNTDIIWSGIIGGRTKCGSTFCATADCGSVGSCLPGRGLLQPATQAEMTFAKKNVDFYDVEVINGVNIPISMLPLIGPFNRLRLQNNSNPYTCGNPGAHNPINPTLGSCSWDLAPPSNEYNWVEPGGNACSSNDSCQSNQVCGLSYDPTRYPVFQKTCGNLNGYWSANEICGRDREYGAPFNCADHLPSPLNNLTMWHLLACVEIGSCYHQGAPSSCCGCVNWDQIGIEVPQAPATQQCVNTNPTWNNEVQTKLSWMKKACPTAYTYPFDDMSSTFTCSEQVNDMNQLNYAIIYCPGGKTGGVS